MGENSFWRVVLIIGLIIVGLGLIVLGLRVYGQYWYKGHPLITTATTNTNNVFDTNTASLGNYVPTVDDDPAIGAAHPKITIIAFEDFQCPYCQESEPIIKQLLQKYPNDVQYVFRDFPLYTIHPQATIAAEAGECADEQNKFWAWHDLVYSQPDQLPNYLTVFPQWAKQLGLNVEQFNQCVQNETYKDEVQKDLNSGILAGVTATPTFFVNGNKIDGVLTLDQWDQVVQQLLAPAQ